MLDTAFDGRLQHLQMLGTDALFLPLPSNGVPCDSPDGAVSGQAERLK